MTEMDFEERQEQGEPLESLRNDVTLSKCQMI